MWVFSALTAAERHQGFVDESHETSTHNINRTLTQVVSVGETLTHHGQMFVGWIAKWPVCIVIGAIGIGIAIHNDW